jgi:hypothetical protein
MARSRTALLTPVALALSIGCATSHGRFDYDASASFAAYHGFAIVEPKLQDEALPLPSSDVARSQLVERRVRAALERELAAKGLRAVPVEAADLVVAFNVSSRRASRVEPFPDGIAVGWPRRWWHDHWDLAYTRVYTEGLLIVDLIDAKSRKLVWRGWTKDPLPESEDMSGVVDHAVREILKNYPPPAGR